MYGAILGDMVGAPYEFDRGNKSKDFEMFNPQVHFTDDSVMTFAIADAILKTGIDADEQTMKKSFVDCMQKWGNKYPNAGYGGRFSGWLRSCDPQPYNSWGNGSAMRVSPVGWLFDSMERTREVARWSAEVTHNHPEGVKGAEATTASIFMARNGAGKAEIRDYVTANFGYDLSRTCDEIRPRLSSCRKLYGNRSGSDHRLPGGQGFRRRCQDGSFAGRRLRYAYLYNRQHRGGIFRDPRGDGPGGRETARRGDAAGAGEVQGEDWCLRFRITIADRIKRIPAPDINVKGSEKTIIPINVAIIGSIVAIIPALLASTLSSPIVYAKNGITAVIKAVRQQNAIRNPQSAESENLLNMSAGRHMIHEPIAANINV